MGDKSLQVEVRGIRELQRALHDIDADLEGELKVGFKAIAEEVAAAARSKVPKVSGKASRSIKARGAKKGASIAFGGTSAPYYPWLDFGGSTGRGHQPGRPGTGAIKRDFTKDGRYVYPTIRDHRDDIVDGTDDLMKRLIEKSGFETKGDN